MGAMPGPSPQTGNPPEVPHDQHNHTSRLIQKPGVCPVCDQIRRDHYAMQSERTP